MLCHLQIHIRLLIMNDTNTAMITPYEYVSTDMESVGSKNCTIICGGCIMLGTPSKAGGEGFANRDFAQEFSHRPPRARGPL
jgi:hypothetical protein